MVLIARNPVATLDYAGNNFGNLRFGDCVVSLTGEAFMTSRLLSDNERAAGLVEWAAHGTDAQGREVRVTWLHKDHGCDEDGEAVLSPENYDWSNVETVEECE